MIFRTRQDARNIINRPAWISVGNALPLLQCTLIDLSESGAKLVLQNTDSIPKTFCLWLSRRGHLRHSCQLVWNYQNIIGVQFIAAADSAVQRSDSFGN
jgi:PilZ domain